VNRYLAKVASTLKLDSVPFDSDELDNFMAGRPSAYDMPVRTPTRQGTVQIPSSTSTSVPVVDKVYSSAKKSMPTYLRNTLIAGGVGAGIVGSGILANRYLHRSKDDS
jgi:hypothetical protein